MEEEGELLEVSKPSIFKAFLSVRTPFEGFYMPHSDYDFGVFYFVFFLKYAKTMVERTSVREYDSLDTVG